MNVRIERLDFSYPRLHVLRGIAAAASAGRITALIGPNAAGKSSLLKCIIGALKPQRGRVLIGDESVHSMSARHAASLIAYVPQRSTVSAAFTVRQVVELGRYALPASAARVHAAIQRLDLEDIADRPYAALSVGQQQRVTLARALAQHSQRGVLALDEPTSAMDLSHTHDVMRLLRQLVDDGAAVLMAMHDLTLAAAVADDAWLMAEGRLVATGPTREVMQPERLRGVFQVGFDWIDVSGSKPILTTNLVRLKPSRDD